MARRLGRARQRGSAEQRAPLRRPPNMRLKLAGLLLRESAVASLARSRRALPSLAPAHTSPAA